MWCIIVHLSLNRAALGAPSSRFYPEMHVLCPQAGRQTDLVAQSSTKAPGLVQEGDVDYGPMYKLCNRFDVVHRGFGVSGLLHCAALHCTQVHVIYIHVY